MERSQSYLDYPCNPLVRGTFRIYTGRFKRGTFRYFRKQHKFREKNIKIQKINKRKSKIYQLSVTRKWGTFARPLESGTPPFRLGARFHRINRVIFNAKENTVGRSQRGEHTHRHYRICRRHRFRPYRPHQIQACVRGGDADDTGDGDSGGDGGGGDGDVDDDDDADDDGGDDGGDDDCDFYCGGADDDDDEPIC